MRAPFDLTCDLYRGPGTATPYNRYAANQPCRLVADPLFVEDELPAGSATHYLTIASAHPAGPLVTAGADDTFNYEGRKADRFLISGHGATLWKAVSVTSCTGPDQAPYWRVGVVFTTEQPLTPCQSGYSNSYGVLVVNTGYTATLSRIGPTSWVGGGMTLVSEATGPPSFGCSSDWVLVGGGVWSVNWTGQAGTRSFPTAIPPAPNNAFVTRL